MASSITKRSPAAWRKFFGADNLSITLKFGFFKNPIDYPMANISSSIIERLYRDAERWVREIANSFKKPQIFGRYTIYLLRIPSTEFSMIPVVQLSDIEQNCLIEIVLVPVEMNQNPHSLFRCQLNKPTNCSKCSGFIAGLYKQGFRCRKCHMTYHKDCTPFLLDDCLALSNGDQASSPRGSLPLSQLTIDNPFDTDSTSSSDTVKDSNSTSVPIYSISISTPHESAQLIEPTTIINKGIFPACIHGGHIYRRYLFCLTTNTLSMTTKLSDVNTRQQPSPQSAEVEAVFPLTDIQDIILTHFKDDRDDIFEIQLQNKTLINVGKKSDSDPLQMETAVFYSAIRDQWETLINATPPPSQAPTASSASDVVTTPTMKQDCPLPLIRKPSTFALPPCGRGNEKKDLHELYAITGETIGEGQFGRVMGGHRKSTHQDVAIKIIDKIGCSELEIGRINGEINYLYKFNHVNILKLEAYFDRDNAVYLVTERMETDMCKYINNASKHYLDEDVSKMLLYQVIVAIRYLHANNCGHLDVKCENILISLLKPIPSIANKRQASGGGYTGDYPLVKLADFGYSRIIGEHSFRKTRVGTKVYNAPEIYRSKEGYNRLVDMWSVGIVLYAALSGTLPYDEKNFQRAEEIVRDKKRLFDSARWKQVSRDAIDLISGKLLVVEPTARFNANDALFHDWFSDLSLYKNLREIEKRTKYLLSTRQQELPSVTNWLTGEREDLVWAGYKDLYEQSKVQNNI